MQKSLYQTGIRAEIMAIQPIVVRIKKTSGNGDTLEDVTINVNSKKTESVMKVLDKKASDVRYGLTVKQFAHINTFYRDAEQRRQAYWQILFPALRNVPSPLFSVNPLVMVICTYCDPPPLPESFQQRLDAENMLRSQLEQLDKERKQHQQAQQQTRQLADDVLAMRLAQRRREKEEKAASRDRILNNYGVDVFNLPEDDVNEVIEPRENGDEEEEVVDLMALQTQLQERFG